MFHLGHCRPADTTQHPESTPCSTRMAKVRSRHLPTAAPAPPDLLKIKSKIQCQSSGDFAASALEVTVSPGCFPPHQLCYVGPLPLFTGQTYVARGAEGAVIYLASLARTRQAVTHHFLAWHSLSTPPPLSSVSPLAANLSPFLLRALRPLPGMLGWLLGGA